MKSIMAVMTWPSHSFASQELKMSFCFERQKKKLGTYSFIQEEAQGQIRAFYLIQKNLAIMDQRVP